MESGAIVNKLPQTATEKMATHYDMVIFSDVRWQSQWQRQQQIASRFTRYSKILFIEPPLPKEEHEAASFFIVGKRLHILQPHVDSIDKISDILPAYLKDKKISIGWFYSSAYAPLLDWFDFSMVIYDCYQQNGELLYQEKYLIVNTDIVFTADSITYETKKKMHPNVYCFADAIDAGHFTKALKKNPIPKDIAAIAKPIAGYAGTISRDIDLELLAQTARGLPEISFVLIGELEKTLTEKLPQETNLHYLGPKSYDELPQYLMAFDIALLPYLTSNQERDKKILEYMAARKPIVSTAAGASIYSPFLREAETPEEFSTAIRLLTSLENSILMQPDYTAILAKTTWEAVVRKMKQVIKTYKQKAY